MPALLTLESLKQITKSFDDFVNVEESDLPDYYKEIFPKKCKCGGEVIISSGVSDGGKFTQMQCCNPDCWVKMAHRFAYFAKSLGYKGFGVATSLAMYEHLHTKFRFPSFLCIFELERKDIMLYNGEAYSYQFCDFRDDLKNNSFQFKDIVAALGIPDFGKNSNIFEIVKDPVVLVDYVLKKKTDELCEMAGIYAPRTRFYLAIGAIDIVTLVTSVAPNVLSTPKKEIYVAITGSVSVEGQALTRSEFIWKCESILDKQGVQAFKLVETKATSKLDFVIADSPSSSSKYKLGAELGILVTADDFYKNLKNSVEEASADE